MRKSYLNGSEPIESYFPAVRPSRLGVTDESDVAKWMPGMLLEAEKEGKFYLISD